jgi:hypothetical protein
MEYPHSDQHTFAYKTSGRHFITVSFMLLRPANGTCLRSTLLAATVRLIATKLQPSNACARIADITQHCHTCHVMLHGHQQTFAGLAPNKKSCSKYWKDAQSAGRHWRAENVPCNAPGAVKIEGRWPLDPDEAQDMPVEPDAGLHIPTHATGMVEGPHWQWASPLTLVFHAT